MAQTHRIHDSFHLKRQHNRFSRFYTVDAVFSLYAAPFPPNLPLPVRSSGLHLIHRSLARVPDPPPQTHLERVGLSPERTFVTDRPTNRQNEYETRPVRTGSLRYRTTRPRKHFYHATLNCDLRRWTSNTT